MNRFYFIAVVLALCVLVIGMVFAAARIDYFVDYASMIMVIVPAAVLCLAAFPPRVIGRSFTVAFSRQTASEQELRQAAVFFTSLQRCFLLSGAIGALIGIVTILAQLQEVAMAKLGQGFALLLITVLYALVLTLVLAVPFRAAVERRLAEKS
ncbi:MAG: MotA/TolQ/ExbB proton channel family protein [Acidobacteria bacterium]|nr:MotA/TolQ/ExbB proton channel family protein [Spirochaetota bacterium]MBE3134995.1 MotA/TolQ/ExbB proton channel family protein [Acidobacteriota bacterium]